MKPIIINNLEFSTKHEKLAGEISLSDCSRLYEQLPKKDQSNVHIKYNLIGHNNKLQAPGLDLNIDAAFHVTCQRCLEPMPITLSLAFHYLISEAESEPDNDTDDYDWLELSNNMNVNDLIEDELLLALPIAPVHAHQCTGQKMQSGAAANPFSILKDIIK